MTEIQLEFDANPSSIHSAGIRAARELEMARIHLGARLGCDPDQVTFTGGATEANNLAIKGAVWSADPGDKHLIVSAIEHPSVLKVAKWLAKTGQARLTILPVDQNALVRCEDLEAAIEPATILVSIMHANNEVGVVQPIAEFARICRENGVLFHTDASQSFLKTPIDMDAWGIDLLTVSGHKVHGPKGVGALAMKKGVCVTPLLHGGDHESGLRSGTPNVAAIAGFGVAVSRFTDGELRRIATLREQLVRGLHEAFPNIRKHGWGAAQVPTIVNVGIAGWTGKDLAKALDQKGLLVSASSACHATLLTPSHVLKAMGQTDHEADEALRISLGRFTTSENIATLLRVIIEVTTMDRNQIPSRAKDVSR